jgi:hypothetical protein
MRSHSPSRQARGDGPRAALLHTPALRRRFSSRARAPTVGSQDLVKPAANSSVRSRSRRRTSGWSISQRKFRKVSSLPPATLKTRTVEHPVVLPVLGVVDPVLPDVACGVLEAGVPGANRAEIEQPPRRLTSSSAPDHGIASSKMKSTRPGQPVGPRAIHGGRAVWLGRR